MEVTGEVLMEVLIGIEALHPLAWRYHGQIIPNVVRTIYRERDGALGMIAHRPDGKLRTFGNLLSVVLRRPE